MQRERLRTGHERYVTIDPANRWQSMGYDYLIDERGCELRPLPRGRGYEPLHRRIGVGLGLEEQAELRTERHRAGT